MPPRARLRLTATARLEGQLEFAGADALRRIALQAEKASREVPSDLLVSEAWLVERLTGVRARDADRAETLVGQAVAMDLAALALRLSERAPFAPAELPGGAVTLATAARELGVTVRSLQRWKRRGLAMVRVRVAGAPRTAISRAALDWCRGTIVAHAPARRREPSRRARLVELAARGLRPGESLHAVARRVARAAGASAATARRALEAGERRGDLPRLRRRERLGDARRAAAWRAWRRGAGLADIAAAVGRSDAATLRLVRRERRDRLRALRLATPGLATFTRADAAATLLAPRAVQSGLACEPWPDEARAFLRRFPPALPGGDRALASDSQRLVALRYLLWRCAREIGALRGADPGPRLDEVEAWLRWAARLRLALVERALPGAIARLQAMRAGPLVGLPPAALRRAIVAAVQAACEAVDEAMAGDRSIERPRLAALAGAAVERMVTGAPWLRPGTAGREVEVPMPAGLRERCAPWCSLVPLRDDLAALAADDEGSRLLALRFGWGGVAPRSAVEAAAQLRLDARRAGQMAAEAFRRLRATRRD